MGSLNTQVLLVIISTLLAVMDAVLFVHELAERRRARKFAQIPVETWLRFENAMRDQVLTTTTISLEQIAFLQSAYSEHLREVAAANALAQNTPRVQAAQLQPQESNNNGN